MLEATTEDSSSSNNRVLVVDDDPGMLEVLVEYLETEGYQVETALDRDSALEAAKAFDPEVVLCDVMLPGVNGFGICKLLKEWCEPNFLPVIMLTARTDIESKLEGFSVGADDYVTKPFENRELLARIRVMLRLREALLKVVALQKRKDEFLNIVSHDLRLPVSVITGFCRHLLKRDPALSADDHESVTRIAANAEFMDRMINLLLGRDTVTRGEIELYPSRIRIDKLLRDLAARNSSIASQKKIDLKLEVAGNLPLLYADENKMVQILNNMLANALRYSDSGGSISLICKVEDNSIQFTVADQGPGVIAEDRQRIFEPFKKSRPSPNQPEKGGAGLGLAIARSLVELHGGRIWVEDTSGPGARITFALPLGHQATDPD